MKAKKLFDSTVDMSNSRSFVAAMLILQSKCPVHHSVVVQIDPVFTDKVPTAATDGIYTYINPDFFKGLESDGQRAFLLAHEAGHVILRHPQRSKFYLDRGYFQPNQKFDPATFNVAGDYVINDDLVKSGLEPIPSGLFSDEYGRDDIVDTVYASLIAQKQNDPESGQDSGSETSQDGPESDSGDDQGDPTAQDESSDTAQSTASGDGDADAGHGGFDEHLTPQYEGDENEQALAESEDTAEIERAVDHGIEEMHRKGVPVPKHIADAGSDASGESDPMDLDFGAALAERMVRAGQGSETSWANINVKRYSMMGVISPQKLGTLNKIAITIDCSPSILTDQRDLFVATVADLLSTIPTREGAVVLFTGAQVHDVHEVTSGYDIVDLPVPNGWGTRMCASCEYLEENGIDVDMHIVFTDGELWDDDWRNLAERECVVVLDRRPAAWIQRDIDASGADVLCAA